MADPHQAAALTVTPPSSENKGQHTQITRSESVFGILRFLNKCTHLQLGASVQMFMCGLTKSPDQLRSVGQGLCVELKHTEEHKHVRLEEAATYLHIFTTKTQSKKREKYTFLESSTFTSLSSR